MTKKNFVFAASFLTMLVVNAAWADIASTKYVTTGLSDKQDKLTTSNIKGSGSVSVEISDDGVITVSGTDNNTTYSTGNTTTSGLTKLYTGIGTKTDGTMTQKALKTALEAKQGTLTAGSNITIEDDGTISAKDTVYTLPAATADTLGGVKTGSNITNDSGTISVPVASSSTLGVVKEGTNITIGEDGTISAKDTVYTLPAATADTLGGVKTGSNITNSGGTISVPVASSSTLGVVKEGTNVSIVDGAVSVATATPDVAGVAVLGVIPSGKNKDDTAYIWVE